VTVALDSPEARPERGSAAAAGLVGAAGIASIGAGAVHAAAIGIHSEPRAAMLTFTAVAAAQLAWGGLALIRPNRAVAAVGAALSAGAVAGWVAAKTSGIGFVDGLEAAEDVQTADALAAGLAAAALVLSLLSLLRRSRPIPMTLAGSVVAVLAVTGMAAAGTHTHDEGEAAAHSHGAAASGPAPADGAAATEASHEHVVQAVAPVPYDPTKPIDLGGVPGVTPEQQAAAENLVAVTLLRLPQWSDPAVAEAAGFRSIGDGFTGIEHFVHREFMNDDVILDPDRPESLVYNTEGGGRRLVAAMYMVKPGTPLEDVPNIGGALMQWHTHDNLCYNAQGKIAGITDADGNCPPGLVKPVETPMIHVWIEPHRCGPFAALEGIGGGRIPEGEERLCDHAHGAA
jgi:hypothetical protein